MPNTMTFEVDVLPNTTSTLNLGSSDKKWKVNGVIPGDALAKNVDSSISSDSSTNLPTTAAVVYYVDNKIDDTAGEGDTDVTWSADKIVDALSNFNPDIIDDTAGSGDTNKTWSANKLVTATAKEVLEYNDYDDFPLTGAAGIIYIDKTTNSMYRWNTNMYTPIGGSSPEAITNNQIDALFT